MNAEKTEDNTSSTLAISLEKSLWRVRGDLAYFNGANIKQTLGLLCIGCIACVFTYAYFRHKVPLPAPSLFLILFVLGVQRARRRTARARELSALYEGKEVPVLLLDAQGFTCPAILLNYSACSRLLRLGENAVRIRWQDVIHFWDKAKVVYNRAVVSPAVYVIRIKEADEVTQLKRITIHKDDFSTEEQDKINYFSQRFLPISIRNM